MTGQDSEMISYNEALMNIDFNYISIDELERHLDLAMVFEGEDGGPFCKAKTFDCSGDSFSCGGTFTCHQTFG